MQIRENAHLAPLDHVLAEAGEVAGPGAAGIDRGRHPAGAAELFRVDAERGAAPINVGVHVDQARRDDVARHVAHLGAAVGPQAGVDLGDLAVRECDIGDTVELLRRVDDTPALQDQVECHGGPLLKAGNLGEIRKAFQRFFAAGPAGHAVTCLTPSYGTTASARRSGGMPGCYPAKRSSLLMHVSKFASAILAVALTMLAPGRPRAILA